MALTEQLRGDCVPIRINEFKVELQSGDVVVVSGRQTIDIGHDYSKAG